MIGIANTTGEIHGIPDEHVLLYINGKSFSDQSQYKANSTVRFGNASLINIMGPFNSNPCPVIFLNTGSIGWTSTNSNVNCRLSQVSGWTFEFWHFRRGVVSSEDLFAVGGYTDTGANCLHCDTTDGYYSKLWRNNTQWSSSTAAPLSNNLWYHVAYVIQNSIVSLYVNGTLKATYNNLGDTNTAQGVMFGGYSVSGWAGTGLNAYIAEARLSNIPRYTSNFIPPTKFLYE